MYLQPIMSALISELTLCHHKRLCCNCANVKEPFPEVFHDEFAAIASKAAHSHPSQTVGVVPVKLLNHTSESLTFRGAVSSNTFLNPNPYDLEF